MFEILISYDLILVIKDFDDSQMLLSYCSQWMDPHTCALLKYLLLNEKGMTPEEYELCYLDYNPFQVAETIRCFDAAMDEDGYLQKWQLRSNVLSEHEQADLKSIHGFDIDRMKRSSFY